MTIEELLDKLEREPLAPAYTLYGPETFFMDQVLHSVLEKAFPDGRYRGVHEVNDALDVVTLYAYRVLYFYETRWSRMFHFVPRGIYTLQPAPPAPAL